MSSNNPKRYRADEPIHSYSSHRVYPDNPIGHHNCEHPNTVVKTCQNGKNAGRDYISCPDCKAFVGWVENDNQDKNNRLDVDDINKQLETLNQNLLKISALFEKYLDFLEINKD